MPRPKLDDPTVPIAFRMKRSAAEWWTETAGDRNTTLPKLLREFGEKVAAFPGGGRQLLDELERGLGVEPRRGLPGRAKRLQRDTVEPRFKKGGKK